ncbi:hypothetical protein, partial [Helicobacter pylori]|uniref:hypothetical protein n=1 Tax=Helicobacter pylori TaxID=210 RepID=UPI001EE491AF
DVAYSRGRVRDREGSVSGGVIRQVDCSIVCGGVVSTLFVVLCFLLLVVCGWGVRCVVGGGVLVVVSVRWVMALRRGGGEG